MSLFDMKRVARWTLLAVVGCSISGPDGPPAQLTELPRALSDNEVRVASAANHFAFTLLKRLSEQLPDSNVFISPLSVSMALGMALNGASGTTLDQMRATLGFDQQQLEEINAGYRDLIALEAGLDPSTTFTIANSVWHRNTIPFHQSYLDLLQATFDAEVKSSPFDQTTVTQVNDWVNAQTNGRITKILDGISPEHVMFLINAIYFKGSWRDGFDPSKTFDGEFETIDGTKQPAKLMNRQKGQGKIRLAFVNGTQVGELSYGNGAFVMTVLVPTPITDANAVAAALDTTAWRGYVEPLQELEGEVVLPRFSLEYERELADDLKALGMPVAFDSRADFSGMSPLGSDMFISFVKHKTFVRVDEVGTEAAAVTNVGVGIVSLPPGLRATSPFIFVIRERFSGTILFIGKIVRIPS
jgi:serine protease inhibitor